MAGSWCCPAACMKLCKRCEPVPAEQQVDGATSSLVIYTNVSWRIMGLQNDECLLCDRKIW